VIWRRVHEPSSRSEDRPSLPRPTCRGGRPAPCSRQRWRGRGTHLWCPGSKTRCPKTTSDNLYYLEQGSSHFSGQGSHGTMRGIVIYVI
jgi:hypothetical protein